MNATEPADNPPRPDAAGAVGITNQAASQESLIEALREAFDRAFCDDATRGRAWVSSGHAIVQLFGVLPERIEVQDLHAVQSFLDSTDGVEDLIVEARGAAGMQRYVRWMQALPQIESLTVSVTWTNRGRRTAGVLRVARHHVDVELAAAVTEQDSGWLASISLELLDQLMGRPQAEQARRLGAFLASVLDADAQSFAREANGLSIRRGVLNHLTRHGPLNLKSFYLACSAGP